MRLDDNITQSQVVTANVNLATIAVNTVDTFSVQLTLSANSGSNAAFKIQGSNDGTNFGDITNMTLAATANGTAILSVPRLDVLYVRGVFTASAGTITAALTWVFRQAVA